MLIQRMKDQLVILRNAYSRELEDIYGAMKQDLDETRDRHQDGWQEKLDEIVAVSIYGLLLLLLLLSAQMSRGVTWRGGRVVWCRSPKSRNTRRLHAEK